MSQSVLDNLRDEIVQANTINSDLYSKFEVKRGLRNNDGSGVLAGLTHISSVVGSKTTDYGPEPVEGILRYRGVSIMDFISQFGETDRYCFEISCFLLLVGRMPSDEEKDAMIAFINANRNVPQAVIDNVIKGLPSKHVMNKLQTAVAALYGYDSDADSIDPVENFYKSLKVIAQFPTIVAYSYLSAYKDNPTFVEPKADMSIAESFLYMLYEGRTPSTFEAYMMDLCLILHAEHGGGNNSSFTAHVVTSSASDLYSTLVAAIGSLKGPLHGAANQKVMGMMDDIKANVSDWTSKDEVCAYLEKLIKKEAHDKSGKIYGLGHAVYTKSDPRAIIIKEHATRLASEKDRADEMTLYKIISEDGPGVFQRLKGSDKVIAPNVDFYSGFVYDCLGIPAEIYTPMFAMGRVSGWCAHRIEEILSGKRIIRPGYKFIG